MLFGPASMRFFSSSGEPLGRSYATSSGPKQVAQAKMGPSSKRSPHSRQESAAAGPRSTASAEELVLTATVCVAMMARPFLLIFLATHFATRRNWHLPHLTSRSAGGLPGLQRAVPSVPLDERCGTGSSIQAFIGGGPRHARVIRVVQDCNRSIGRLR